MTTGAVGLVLVWSGAVAAGVVLVARFRAGAWSAEAFDRAPAISPAAMAALAVGLVAALAGVWMVVKGSL